MMRRIQSGEEREQWSYERSSLRSSCPTTEDQNSPYQKGAKSDQQNPPRDCLFHSSIFRLEVTNRLVRHPSDEKTTLLHGLALAIDLES